jgi:DNA helicase-2/ATP-dependent DNA helicase PcrA
VFEDDGEGVGTLRAGSRVRHPQFGVGTVLSVEPTGSDTKLTVRFQTVGQKRLLASFARLEPA